MSNAFIYTPCKDRKFETCRNYQLKCEECTRRYSYTVLLAKPHKDYYESKRR